MGWQRSPSHFGIVFEHQMIAEDVPGQLVDLPVVLMDVEPGRVNTTSRAAAQCR
ncbi:hypothetical protein X772_24445 [Mesorhizobium sp. LSJC280B00]|nr:hypothetical protein X772_24445 [Mesorhizobium sp. LSJC280B00]